MRCTSPRMHLALEVPDITGAVARLLALRATRISDVPCVEGGGVWIVMADPEGYEFCVVDAGGAALDRGMDPPQEP